MCVLRIPVGIIHKNVSTRVCKHRPTSRSGSMFSPPSPCQKVGMNCAQVLTHRCHTSALVRFDFGVWWTSAAVYLNKAWCSWPHNDLVCQREMNDQARTGLLHQVRMTSRAYKKTRVFLFCLISFAVKKFGCGSTPIVSGQRLTFGPWWIGFSVTALVCVYVKFRANKKTRVFLFWCMNIAGFFFWPAVTVAGRTGMWLRGTP